MWRKECSKAENIVWLLSENNSRKNDSIPETMTDKRQAGDSPCVQKLSWRTFSLVCPEYVIFFCSFMLLQSWIELWLNISTTPTCSVQSAVREDSYLLTREIFRQCLAATSSIPVKYAIFSYHFPYCAAVVFACTTLPPRSRSQVLENKS